MKQRDTPTCPSWRQQLLVFASYLVHRRVAQGPSPGVFALPAARRAADAKKGGEAHQAGGRGPKNPPGKYGGERHSGGRKGSQSHAEKRGGTRRVHRRSPPCSARSQRRRCVGTSPFVCWAAARGHSGPSGRSPANEGRTGVRACL